MSWTAPAGGGREPPPTRTVPRHGLARSLRGANAPHAARQVVLHHGWPGAQARDMELGRVSKARDADVYRRHQLRDQVDQARHEMAWRQRRYAARGRPG